MFITVEIDGIWVKLISCPDALGRQMYANKLEWHSGFPDSKTTGSNASITGSSSLMKCELVLIKELSSHSDALR